jgi:Lrp/AsnC family transcriptional regulator for asnA, asnC and gidA
MNEIIELDQVDRELLKILQDNADLTYSDIGKLLNLSPSTVYMRIKRLKDKGFIRRVVAEVDPNKLGYRLRALVFLDIDIKKYSKVVDQIKDFEQVKTIYDVTGEWALVLEVLVRDHKELSELLDKIGNLDGVHSTSTMVVLRVIKEERKIVV